MKTAIFETNRAIAQADFTNPFISTITFILTDFLPNRNGQAISFDEADHIVQTAQDMPLKINLETGGHEGAETVGPITKAWLGEDNGKPVVYAEAIIWKLEYPEVDNYIKTQYEQQQPLAVSWELLFSDSEIDQNNVEWLQNVAITGVALVSNPAYGMLRTRVLAVAETVEGRMTETDLVQHAQSTPAPEATRAETIEHELEQARREITSLREQVASLKAELTFAQRKDILREFFRDVDERRDFVLSLSEEAFRSYVNDLRMMQQAAKSEIAQPAQAGVKPSIPANLPTTIDVVALLNRLI